MFEKDAMSDKLMVFFCIKPIIRNATVIVQGKMQQTIAYEAKIRDLINWVNLEKVLDIVK